MKQMIYKNYINTTNLFSFYHILDLKTQTSYLNILYNKTYKVIPLSKEILIFPSYYYLYLFSKKKNILNMIIKLIYNKSLEFNYKYQLHIELIGIGYKSFYRKNFLFFVLGYSHLIKIKLPKNCNINIENNGKLLHLTYSNKYILGNLFYIIKSFKFLNIYKGKGIKNVYDKLKLKLGKTKSIKK